MRPFLSAIAPAAVLSLVAGHAAAQDLTCGPEGSTGAWIGGSPDASDISLAQGPLTLSGVSVPQNGHAVAYFSASARTEVRLEAQPAPGGDSVLELYDAAGELVITDDDSGGALASRAETTIEPGQYCLAARGFAGNALITDLRVGLLEHEAITAGLNGGFFGDSDGPIFVGVDPCFADTPATPLFNFPLNEQFLADGGVSAVNTITEAPYYRFTLGSAQALSIRAENPSADPYIYLFDGGGNLLAENDDFESLNSRIDFTAPLEAGTYCIGMRALSNPDLPVTVSIVGFDANAALQELYASGEAAPPLDGSFPVIDLGQLPPRSVRDVQVTGTTAVWYAFDVPQNGALVVDAVEVTDSDPMIFLYNDIGAEIAFNDDSNGTFDSQIVARVTPGRYLLAVRQFSEDYSGIIRVATERFVPASQ